MQKMLVLLAAGLLISCTPDGSEENTGPEDVDTDGDGWPDAYERRIGTNPGAADPDSDGDGLPDDLERRMGTNEHDADSDDDGIPDGDEDPDGDHLPTWFELKIHSNPADDGSDNDEPDGWGDQDGDGLIDWLEFAQNSDPFKKDTDGDGVNDLDESNEPELDATNPDSDGDGIGDGEDAFITPEGCSDRDSGVRHTYNSCVGGVWHTITVRYYLRECPGEPVEVMPLTIEDLNTGQPCDETPSGPPPLSEVQ